MNTAVLTDSTGLWREVLARPDINTGQLLFRHGKLTIGQISRIQERGNQVTFFFAWTAAKFGDRWVRRYDGSQSFNKDELKAVGDGTFMFMATRLIPAGHPLSVDESQVMENPSTKK